MSTAKIVWSVIGVIALIVVVIAGIYAATVALSAPKGRGDAYIQKNSAANWTKAQAEFEQIYADVEATDLKIDNAGEAVRMNPKDAAANTNLQGLKSYCQSRIAEYNAKSRSYLSQDFKSADLPLKLDGTQHCQAIEPTPAN